MSDEKRIAQTTRTTASLSALDIEILRFITRFQMVRPHHVAAWTGASPHTIAKRGLRLRELGLVKRWQTDALLRDADGRIRPTICTVWSATGPGASLAGEWEVPGTGQTLSLAAPRPSRLMSHHTLGVADLACWYRTSGYRLAAEREILSIEKPTALRIDHQAEQHWSVTIPGRTGIHPPDLGAVHPDGGMWAIELERATKTVDEYTEVIRAYRAVGLGQVWHIARQATARRITEACLRLGVQWGPPPARGVTASAGDGLIRLQGWVPGRGGLRGPATWAGQVPRTPPAGIEVPRPFPDLAASWRRGQALDPEDAADWLGGVLV